jgi:O-antigen ligase
MPVHIAIRHLTHARVWEWRTVLFLPETVVTVLLAILVFKSPEFRRSFFDRISRDGELRVIFWIAIGFSAWYCVSAVAQGSLPEYWLRNILIAWLLPIVVATALLALGTSSIELAWKGLKIGVTALLLEALVLYLMSFGVPRSFEELVFVNRTGKAFWGPRQGIYFGALTLGNFNDIALFFAACGAYMLGQSVDDRRQGKHAIGSLAFFSGCLVLEYLCYSRGCIIALFVVSGAWIVICRRLHLRVTATMAAYLVGLGLFALMVFASQQSREYWAGQFVGQVSSTARFRLTQWSSALDGERLARQYQLMIPEQALRRTMQAVAEQLRPGQADTVKMEETRAAVVRRIGSERRRMWLGYGPGNYGLLVAWNYDSGTHNAFVDAFVATGLPGALLFGALWLLWVVRVARNVVRASLSERGASLGILLGVLLVTIGAIVVNFQVESLGLMLNGAILWLVVVSARITPGPQGVAATPSSG